MKKRKIGKETKFCPRCGSVLKATDAYCIRCGYSFVSRVKKNKANWMRLILILIILAAAYLGIRKFVLHKPILPDFSALFKLNKTG